MSVRRPAGRRRRREYGIENDLTEILADDTTRNVKQGLSAPPTPPAAIAA